MPSLSIFFFSLRNALSIGSPRLTLTSDTVLFTWLTPASQDSWSFVGIIFSNEGSGKLVNGVGYVKLKLA